MSVQSLKLTKWRGRIVLLAGLVCACLASSPRAEEVQASSSDEPLLAEFYFVPDCPGCKPTTAAVDRVAAKFKGRLTVKRYDLNKDPAAFDAYIDRLDSRGIQVTPKMIVFVGDRYVAGEHDIINMFEATVAALLEEASDAPSTDPAKPEPERGRGSRVSLALLIWAALGDGVNPCAFATVILFVSMLSAVGRGRREIALTGLSFIVGVVVTYYLIGLFFYRAMQSLEGIHVVAQAVNWFAFGLVCVAFVLSLVDAVRAWQGAGGKEMVLALPERLKKAIRRRLTATAHSASLVGSALMAGVVVAILESACTGQVYFPLLLRLVQEKDTMMRGLALLAVYNLVFALPLAAVFGAVLYGVTSDRIAGIARERLWLTKLIMATVFFSMAVSLGGYIFTPESDAEEDTATTVTTPPPTDSPSEEAPARAP